MKILILGRNPSRTNISPDIPFIGAPCYKRIKDWVEYLTHSSRLFVAGNCTNSLNAKFNKFTIPTYASTLKSSCVAQNINCVVALGNDSARVCEVANMKYFKLPHPSGLNRLVNNREKIKEALRACDEYIKTIES